MPGRDGMPLQEPELNLAELLRVSFASHDTFEGHCLAGASGRIFGGQVAAQAFRAASLRLKGEFRPSSSHSLFLRPGNPAIPVRYSVTELKVGRSLSNYRIDATQLTAQGERSVILTAFASFHLDEPSRNYQDVMPETISAQECGITDYIPPGSNPAVRAPIEFRWPDSISTSLNPAPPRQLTWFRCRSELPDEYSLHASALVYISDLTLSRTAHMPLRKPELIQLGASLDHILWFHRPFKVGEWMLFDQVTTTFALARALSNGKVFSASGELIATVTQEALIRSTSSM